MKKNICFIMIVLALLFVKNVYASSWYYKWENVYIDVELNDSIYNYTSMPKARLYNGDKELSDANISYNTTGDWLYYLKDVNTNKVGEYKVWYKANESKYRPGTCQNYKQLVVFNVKDMVNPKIVLSTKSINIPLNCNKYDYSKLYHVYDQSATDKDVIVNDDGVDYKKVGDYQVFISVYDASNNYSVETLDVHVVDQVGPVISTNNANFTDNRIILEKGKKFDYRKYFQAIDEVDGDVTNNFRLVGILDINTPGIYNVQVEFSNSRENKSIKDIIVEVTKSPIGPTLDIDKDYNKLKFHYETTFNDLIFKRLILKAEDEGVNLIDEVTIDYSNIRNEVGSYTVYFMLIDSDGNSVKEEVVLNLVSFNKPTLLVEDITVYVGESLDLKDYVKITDASDPNVIDTLKIDSKNVNFTVEGIYYASVSCHNSSGLSSTANMKITVLSKEIIRKNNIKYVVLLALGIVFVSTSIVYIYKKKRKEKDEFIQ